MQTADLLQIYRDLMHIFSRPRPPGSAGERATAQAIRTWLEARGIPYQTHTFTLYPFFFESIGLWILLSRTALALVAWFAPGWPALVLAVVGLLGGVVDILVEWPLVTWMGCRPGENILITFEPPNPLREVVLAAHYDSKTELLDHRQRALFVNHTRLWSGLTLLVGLLAAVEGHVPLAATVRAGVHALNAGLALVLLAAAWGLGLHLSLGRLVTPSQGAVDNGAACAVLLRLAERLAREGPPRDDVRITLALFTGEEANMQGSRAYVRSRTWPLPTYVVNLEILGQDGPYVVWQQDGDAFRRVPASEDVRTLLARAVEQVTGKPPETHPLLNTDAFSFLRAGIPAATLGTLSTRWGIAGLHRPTDNLRRVVLERLPEHEAVLWAVLERV